MKNYLSKLVALALFAMALTGATLAQDGTHAVRANIPFSFYAGREMLPAGEYTISINMEDHLVIIGQKSDRKEFLSSRLTGRQLTRRTDCADLQVERRRSLCVARSAGS